MKWEDISKRLPGRSAISCRLHYQNYLERRSEWDEERKNKEEAKKKEAEVEARIEKRLIEAGLGPSAAEDVVAPDTLIVYELPWEYDRVSHHPDALMPYQSPSIPAFNPRLNTELG